MHNKYHILLIEDSPTDVMLTEEALAKSTYTLEHCARLGDAIELLNEKHFDAVLLDLGLPDSQGLKTLEALRKRNLYVPVVLVLTGRDDEMLALEALKTGAHDYLVKSELQDGALPRAIRYAIQRSKAETSQRYSEERYRTLVAASSAIVWDTPASGEFERVQPGWTAFTGQTFDELRGMGWLNAIHPDDRAKSGQCWLAAMTQKRSFHQEHRLRRADGEYRHMSVRCIPIKESDGTIREWVGVHTDVTEQRRAEEEREGHLKRLKLHIERMPLAYILYDAACRILDWNPAAERIFGYTRQEMLGQGPPFAQVIPKDSWAEDEVIRGRIRAGDMNVHTVNENITKDGRKVICQCFNTPLVDENGHFSGHLCLARDMTEQKALEVQYRQAQKMEAFGQLASGVAHDFNNLLTVISGYSEMLLERLGAQDASHDSLNAIHEAGQRAAGLTRQLLAFSRQTVLELKVLDLNLVVRETAKFLRRLIGEDIVLTTDLDDSISKVKVDQGLLGQILMNLAVNARDAMPQGGTLTIETSDLELDAAYASRHPGCKPGRYVKIAVSDNGCGMSPEVKAHIFEPFFTTKEPGKGTGLGLATVYGIVQQSEGMINLSSEPGHGTTFKIYFPAVEGTRTGSAHDRPNPRVTGGSETLLLVEDEYPVRAMALLALQSQGYKVLEAESGRKALAIAEKHGSGIDMLVTDVVMPGMSGRELRELLAPLFPNLKVLYMSGYTDDSVIRHGILQVEVAFLQKPYTPLSLARKVREVLDK